MTAFQLFHTSGPTPLISQTVKTVSSLSLFVVLTILAKSRMVFSSERSLFWDISDISKWFLISHDVNSTS